jgi:hypothetical protein
LAEAAPAEPVDRALADLVERDRLVVPELLLRGVVRFALVDRLPLARFDAVFLEAPLELELEPDLEPLLLAGGTAFLLV